MIADYKKYELFGKALFEKMVLTPPYTIPNPMPNRACFLYILEGDTNYIVKEENINIKAKDAVLLNCSNYLGQLINNNSYNKNELIIVHFHPEVLKKIYEKELPDLFKQNNIAVYNRQIEKINNDFLIQKYIEGLLFYFENPTTVDDDILILKVKEILLLLSKTKNADSIKQIFSQLFSQTSHIFKQIIENNIHTNLTIDEIAQQTNLSLSSFRREFERLYNDTPANYFRNRKLSRAAELLRVSDERITDIAYKCGFEDLANFSKNFLEKFNTTPSNYRLTQKDK